MNYDDAKHFVLSSGPVPGDVLDLGVRKVYIRTVSDAHVLYDVVGLDTVTLRICILDWMEAEREAEREHNAFFQHRSGTQGDWVVKVVRIGELGPSQPK